MRPILILSLLLLLSGCGLFAVATKKNPTEKDFKDAERELSIADQTDDLLPAGVGTISSLILAGLGAWVGRKKLLASKPGEVFGKEESS